MAWQPDYITAAQLKAYARIGDDLDDDEVTDAVTSASRAVDRATSRQFGLVAAPEERAYPVVWDRHRGRWIAVVDDVATETGMSMTLSGTDITGWVLEPRNAVLKGKVWERVVLPAGTVRTSDEDELLMTAAWGWPAVPTTVVLATKLQGSRFLARRNSPYGIAGSPDQGSELRLLARVDPDVRVSLGGYIRQWAVR